jgi:hypothetical protein
MNKIMPTDHPYLYRGSLSEARRNNEVDRWRESHRLNIACKEAIEDAIRNSFDGTRLAPDCARKVIEAQGFLRTAWVLSNTIQQKNYDDRFSRRNREWANEIFIPKTDRNTDFIVESHSAVLNGFVDEYREALAQLGLFDRSHCESLSGQDLEDKILVIGAWSLKESCWCPQNQLWLAGSGFGCYPNASGRAVYATCLGDGENARWNRSDFLGILKDEYLPDWAKKSLEALR